MKSTKQFFLPILLGLLTILALGCQAETPEAPAANTSDAENKTTSEAQMISIDEITQITWQWVEWIENNPAAQSVVPDPENYTLTIWNDGSFSFKADCNVGNGTYSVNGNKIEFGPTMTTLAMCPPDSLHDQFLALLGEIDTFGKADQKLFFTLKDDKGEIHFANGGPAEKPSSPSEKPEPEIKTFFVGPEKVSCGGVGPMECLQIKEDPNGEWQLFYNPIEGFDWAPGYTYEIRVAIYPVENPPADSSSLRYELMEVVNQVETPVGLEKPTSYITIEHPTNGSLLDPSQPILIRGMGAGLFEGNVVVKIEDSMGNELALEPTILQSPDAGMGGEGTWQAELMVKIASETPAKILAFSPSPKDGADWIASDQVFVTLLPGPIPQITLENTPWQLISLTDGVLNSALAVYQATALFSPVEGQISGIGGCNRYFGGYELNGNQLQFPGPIGATRMMCPEPQMNIEFEYLTALEKVKSYEIKSDRNLYLLDAQDNAILVFQVDPYTTTENFTREELANTSYLNEFAISGLVQLVEGVYREPVASESATELIVLLSNFAAFGDLDGNGQEEAVVVLVSNPGGSGSFYDLAVVRKQGAALTNISVQGLGDRVQIQNLHIENGGISVEMLTQGSDDPMCCPTQKVINIYRLENGELVLSSSEVIE